MSRRSVVTRSMSWDWVTKGDGLPGSRVARRAGRVARGRLVTVPSFAHVLRLVPVPHRGVVGGPCQGQGANRFVAQVPVSVIGLISVGCWPRGGGCRARADGCDDLGH